MMRFASVQITLRPIITWASAFEGKTIRTGRGFAAASYAFRPRYAEAHDNLGNVLAEMDRKEEAVLEYKAALEENPDYVDVLMNLGAASRAENARIKAPFFFARRYASNRIIISLTII